MKKKLLKQDLIDNRPFLTIQQAAEYLSISPCKLYFYVSKGLIGYHKPVDIVYFTIKDLNDFVLNRPYPLV